MMLRRLLPVSAPTLLVVMALACQTHQPSRDEARPAGAGRAFLSNLKPLQGQSFRGRVDEAHTPENPFAGQELLMIVQEVTDRSARIALHVGEDRSRTWVITTEPDGRLRLRHDHREPDGTPHEQTDYGGVAAGGGTAWRQSFPADAFTAELLPAAATNVWTLILDRENEQFVYDLTRHGRPRFRAIFNLATASDAS